MASDAEESWSVQVSICKRQVECFSKQDAKYVVTKKKENVTRRTLLSGLIPDMPKTSTIRVMDGGCEDDSAKLFNDKDSEELKTRKDAETEKHQN